MSMTTVSGEAAPRVERSTGAPNNGAASRPRTSAACGEAPHSAQTAASDLSRLAHTTLRLAAEGGEWRAPGCHGRHFDELAGLTALHEPDQ